MRINILSILATFLFLALPAAMSAQVAPVLAAPSGTVDLVVGGTDPAFTGTITVGEDLAVSFQATDGDATDTLTTTVSVTGGSLSGAAAGFSETFPFAPTGAVSPHTVSLTGTAAAAGTIQLTILVDDGNSMNDSYTLDITVAAANNDPVLAAPSGLADIVLGGTDPSFTGTATVGDDIAITFQATDADGGDTLTTTVSVTGGTLSGAAAGFNETFPFAPAGTTSPHSVSLTGTAAAAGTITLTVSVDDGNSGVDTYTVAITISAANNDPVLAAPSGLADIVLGGTDPTFTGTATVGQDLAITFQATDADGGDTLTTTVSVTGGTLSGAAAGFNETFPFAPTGTTSPHSVSLTGTAAAAGTITLTVSVDDGNSGTDSYTVDITISAGNANPVLGTPNATGDISVGGTDPNFTGSALIGEDLAIDFGATDANGTDTLTTTITVTGGTLTGAQAGFTENLTTPFTPTGSTSPHTVSLTGTAGQAGTIELTIDVDDGNSGTDQIVFTLTISAAPTITVGSPNGGENFTVGGNMTVTWSSSGIAGTVDIMLSTNSGGSFAITLSGATANDGTETIVVPNNPGTTCRVRVRDTANPGTTFDDSDADFTIAVPAPAAVNMSAQGNPGSGNANPGTSRTALGFRLTETGGASTFTVTSVTARVTLINNTGNAAANAVSSISLRRGSTVLGTHTSATWSLGGNVITLNFTGLSSNVTAGSTADFTLVISFSASAVPSPNPGYQADIATADVNGGASVSGAAVTGGTITLVEQLPDDPLDDDDDNDSCNLSTRGGPAWPVLFIGVLVAIAAMRRRKMSA